VAARARAGSPKRKIPRTTDDAAAEVCRLALATTGTHRGASFIQSWQSERLNFMVDDG
jgi:hypothetical protein